MCGADAPEYPEPTAEERALRRAQLDLAGRAAAEMGGFGAPAANMGAMAYAHKLNQIESNPYLGQFLERGDKYLERQAAQPEGNAISLPFSGTYQIGGAPGLLAGGLGLMAGGEQIGLLQMPNGTVAPVMLATSRQRLRRQRTSAEGEGAGTPGIGVGGIGSGGADPAGMGPGMGW